MNPLYEEDWRQSFFFKIQISCLEISCHKFHEKFYVLQVHFSYVEKYKSANHTEIINFFSSCTFMFQISLLQGSA